MGKHGGKEGTLGRSPGNTAKPTKAKHLAQASASSMELAEAQDLADLRRRERSDAFAIVGPGGRDAPGTMAGAVSLDSLGLRHQDLLPRDQVHPALAAQDEGGVLRPASSLVGTRPAFVPDYALAFAAQGGMDTFSVAQPLATAAQNGFKQLALLDTNPYQQKTKNGRVIQNWTQPIPVAPGAPILEIVTNRIARSLVSYRYYLSDGVAGPAIDTLSEFPLNRGFDLQAVYASDEMPPWFDPDWVEEDALVDAYGDNRTSTVVAAWVTEQCEQLTEDLNLVYQMVDLQKESYIHGDSFMYRVDEIKDQGYKKDHTQIYPENTISDLQGLNPTAVWLSRDATGITNRIVVIGQPGVVIDELAIENTIHLKHRGSSFTTYGFPHLARAFKDLALKENYQDAAMAWAQRYSIPIRMLTYGVLVRGGTSAGPIATPTMRAAAEAAVQQYDPASGQTIVAPFHWEYKFIGADGNQAMLVSNELMEANRRIMAALDIPSAFLYGDWTNYATARIQYSGLMHRLKVVQESLRRILEQRIFQWFCTIRGYVDAVGQPIRVNVRWKRAHLEDDQSFMEMIAALAAIPGFLSLKTGRESIGFDNDTEVQNLKDEQDHAILQMQKAKDAGLNPADPTQPKPPPAPRPQPQPVVQVAAPAPAPSKQQQGKSLKSGKAKADLALASFLAALPAQAEAAHELFTTASVASDTPFFRGSRLRYKQLAALSRAYELRLAAWEDENGPTRPVGDVGSMMVSFCLDPDVARSLALAYDGDGAGMHITLAYVKTANGDDVRTAHQAVTRAVRGFSALTASLSGIGRFPASASSGGKDVLYAQVGDCDLGPIRTAVLEALSEAGIEVSTDHPVYTPHVTLAYVDPELATPKPHYAKAQVTLGCVDVVGAGRHLHTTLADAVTDEAA